MKRPMIILAILVVVLFLVAGCLYWMPMHRERPGTNREALGTTDPASDSKSGKVEMLDGLNPETILDDPDGTSTHAFKGTQNYNQISHDNIKVPQ